MRSKIKLSIIIALINLLLLYSSIHAAVIPDLQWQTNHGTTGPDLPALRSLVRRKERPQGVERGSRMGGGICSNSITK